MDSMFGWFLYGIVYLHEKFNREEFMLVSDLIPSSHCLTGFLKVSIEFVYFY
jgi:hypothetical protein